MASERPKPPKSLNNQHSTWRLEGLNPQSRPTWLIQSDKDSSPEITVDDETADDSVEAHHYNRVLLDTSEFLALSAQHYMPDTPFRDYYVWALSQQNEEREKWLQLIGVRQTVLLTATKTITPNVIGI